ncbi:YcjF family protein [Roseovarius salinarum]|uniref:YcjF family protein n=1 Tax=Roseovarius salinarum TaxID=1981892 RepID=UPI000C331A51|nr:TIGR01620 family protein [Roseovarius salinarum]
MTKGPILIDLEEGEGTRPGPDAVPPVPDPEEPDGRAPEGRAMQTLAGLAARRPSWLARAFWTLLAAVIAAAVSVAAWDFAAAMIARHRLLGYAVAGLLLALVAVLAAIALREAAGFARLRRIDRLQRAAARARSDADLSAAREVTGRLDRLYAGREDTRWGRARLAERGHEQFDAAGLLDLAEAELLAPLDTAAAAEVQAAARQVAAATALVPLALVDVVAALGANMRMIRRIAEIYGGRAGTLGSWRLARAVLTHLVATGAVAVGDDLLGSIAGGGLVSKLSRRFGEGLVNGALTARVGVAAMEVCRPVSFGAGRRPSVSGLVKRALTGLFGQS